jgi:protein-disulfide isomerase
MTNDAYASLLTPDLVEDHVLGRASAEATLVEYGDFQCPICRQAYPVVKLQLDHFGDRIRFVFRHFPMREVHPFAELAAEASEAAAMQDRFWDFYNHFFSLRPAKSGEEVLSIGAELGLDLTKFQMELSTHEHLLRVRKDMAVASRLGVRATPTFYLNGRIVDVSYGMGKLRSSLDAVLSTSHDSTQDHDGR